MYMEVTADDIQRVAKKYLTEDNRTAVTAIPPSS
jgi:predicted Zn-dependent peptidase